MTLRGLDDRVVPLVARKLQELRDWWRADVPLGTRFAELDRRYADRGILALLRDVPQLGYAVLALVVAVNGLTFLHRETNRQAATPTTSVSLPPDAGTNVGPVLGNRVLPYLTTRKKQLADSAAREPDRRAIAVVSFNDYQTYRDLVPLLEPVSPVRVFLRVPVPKEQTQIRSFGVRNFLADTIFGYRLLYASLVTDAQSNLTQAATTTDRDFINSYKHDSRLWYKEAAALQKDCACIFAVAVVGPLGRLLDLSLAQGVRLVDLAPSGVPLAELSFRGLLPEEKVTVTGLNEGPQ